MARRAEGWHEDPERPGLERYWDGKEWTGLSRHRVEAQPPTGATTPPAARPEPAVAPSTTVPDDLAVWLTIAWLFVAAVLLTAVPGLTSVSTGLAIGVHLGLAELDLGRNPRLAELSWRRTSLVVLPPVYLARRQRLLGQPAWHWVAWVLAFGLAAAGQWLYVVVTASIEDVTVAEVEQVMVDAIDPELTGGLSVEVDCEDVPLTEGGTIDCVATFSDGSSVVLRTTTTVDEISWEPVPGTETLPDG